MSHAPPDHRRLEEALARFGRLLEATVRRTCPRDLGIDTADVLQDARMRLWRFLERATASELSASYVYRVAASAAIDATRSVVARREDRMAILAGGGGDSEEGALDPPADVRQSPELLARGREVARAIESALGELSPPRERAVRLHLIGLSSPEISRLTGWSETKTRSLISRGLRDLRARLNERGIEHDVGP